jgi:hypothetical protein
MTNVTAAEISFAKWNQQSYEDAENGIFPYSWYLTTKLQDVEAENTVVSIM